MNTKEKLELLWKYLFLAVIAAGIFRFTDRNNFSMMTGHPGGHDMLFFGDDDHEMDVRVEKEIVDGDTIMTVIVNGEEVDASSFSKKEGKLKWVSKDGEVIVIDNDDEANGHDQIIKKKVIVKKLKDH